jgi:thymidylate synthase (FAD)
MKLIKPSHKILALTLAPEHLIEEIGRVCYKSEGLISAFSYEPFIKKLLKSNHESVIEHAVMSVKFICDRGVTHEIVRHRLASYSQESTRYCNYKGGVTFIIPPWSDIQPGEYNVEEDYPKQHEDDEYWFDSMLSAERYYEILLHHGWSPQMARAVLPNSLKTEIIMTANLREWRHVLRLRTSKAAHPQMRELMIPLLLEVKKNNPILFMDINVEDKENK